MPSREENSYAAGLFDGEGSVMLTRNHKYERFRRPAVSVASTTRSLLEFLQKTYGGWISKKNSKKSNHSKSWHWKVTHSKAIEFLQYVTPYLREPEKVRRANLLTNDYVKTTNRGGHYTDEMVKIKLELEKEFYKNSKNPSKIKMESAASKPRPEATSI